MGACGAAGASPDTPAKVARREYRMRGKETKCPGRYDLDPRTSCAEGEGRACYKLVQKAEPPREHVELARRTLERLCARDRAELAKSPGDLGAAHDRTCDCGMYGYVLAIDHATEAKGIVLLDEACVNGWVDACDTALLIIELCPYVWTPACDDLKAQGRIRVSFHAEEAQPCDLGKELRGCFVVTHLDEGASPYDAPAVGTTLCFENDRVSTKAAGKPWDQQAVAWRGFAGVGVYWPSSSNRRLTRQGSEVVYGRAHLAPAPPSATREATALPFVKDVCERARRCVEAAKPRPRPPPHQEDLELDAPPSMGIAEIDAPPDTLLICQERERAACRPPIR